MKKIYFLLLSLTGILVAHSQTIYSENFGTPGSTTLISAYTGWQNVAPIAYTGSGDVRTSAPSNTYPGFSGSGNVFLTSTAGKFLQIDGINTSSYTAGNIQFSFGYLTSSVALAQLVVEKSVDGGANWLPITFTQNANSSWALVSITNGQIPSATNLSLRFTQPATAQMRIDDIKLVNVSASCTLSLGVESTICAASTSSLDQYTVTIPYTGGANATYTVTGGTVSGDNPTTVASGNIIVTLTEGTNYTINISGGTCNFDVNGNSPECKATNTLPFTENFNYTAGQTLGSQQNWTNVNSGDDVIIKAGNLTYGALAGTGNSIEISGAGKDLFTPFTSTTNGTIYAGFMMKVSDFAGVTLDGKEDYFALFTDAAKGFQSRFFIKKVGTQYQLGLDSAGITTTNYDTTLRDLNDVVYVIVGYDFAANTLSAWLNPNLATFTAATTATLTNAPATPIVEIAGFMFRQGDNNNLPTIEIDELKISITPSIFLGTNSFNAISGLTMYPNPVSGSVLNISSQANGNMGVQIFDILGKQVLKATVNNNAINISSLQAGVYVIKITEEGKTATRKLVVN